MKRGIYTQGGASCKLAYSQAVPAHMRGGILEVLSLETKPEHRGKGHAKALIAKICGLADFNRVTLLTMPLPFGTSGLSKTELIAFYQQAGFFCIQDSPALLMARPPLGK
jgi:GNAT superfamily N-acetyltransferase